MSGTAGEPTAFYFDRAVYTFGSALQAQLDQAGQTRGKKKKTDQQIAMAKQRVMARWLGTEQKFADPLAARR